MSLKQWLNNGWLRTHKTSKNDYVGAVTENDVNEIIEFTKELKSNVYDWLKRQHPELCF